MKALREAAAYLRDAGLGLNIVGQAFAWAECIEGLENEKLNE
jgi:hypothetical protein